MNYIAGLLIASFAIFAALTHLNQGPAQYWDFVAFAMVIGGTTAVAVVVFPMHMYRQLILYFKKLIFNIRPDKKAFLQSCMDSISIHRNGTKVTGLPTNRPEYRILADGFELISLGIAPEKIKAILDERINRHLEDIDKIAGSVKSLAKYPPAFGLTGTVLGLVELMRAVSSGMPAKETGVKMAIALVATLYGLLVANLIISPAAEQIQKMAHDEEKLSEIAMQAVLLAASDSSLLESQEMLNSMVNSHERVSILGAPELIVEEAA